MLSLEFYLFWGGVVDLEFCLEEVKEFYMSNRWYVLRFVVFVF